MPVFSIKAYDLDASPWSPERSIHGIDSKDDIDDTVPKANTNANDEGYDSGGESKNVDGSLELSEEEAVPGRKISERSNYNNIYQFTIHTSLENLDDDRMILCTLVRSI